MTVGAHTEVESPYDALVEMICKAAECARCGGDTDEDFNCPMCGLTSLARIEVVEVS